MVAGRGQYDYNRLLVNLPLSRTERMTTDPAKVLSGRWAVVTGSSSGIGRAIAVELSAAGANVIVHGHRRRSAADQLAESLCEGETQAESICCDLADPQLERRASRF